MTSNTDKMAQKWMHPNDVMEFYKLKKKKKALQARFVPTNKSSVNPNDQSVTDCSVSNSFKRKNPFIKQDENKKPKCESVDLDETSNQTLFKLLNLSNPTPAVTYTSFNNILKKAESESQPVENGVKNLKQLPIDWGLKSKLRFISTKPFTWSQKLKINEEASGVTGFVRCLSENSSSSSLDLSHNAKFHQYCLYWQHPTLPWLTLFPRLNNRVATAACGLTSVISIKESLQVAWSDSLRSLFHLVRTRQCPYFYICANNCTILFRAAGIGGHAEIHALITPTTKGLRHLLMQENIEFTMPLKAKPDNSQLNHVDDNDDELPENCLQSLGISEEELKQFHYVQTRADHKAQCTIDNTEESLVLVEGEEIHALYNFLINCKSLTPITGPLAGVPPTLLAPVGFQGAALSSLKVKESKILVENSNYYSIELNGPILPHMIHNLCDLHTKDHDFNVTFNNVSSTEPFSKIKFNESDSKRLTENIFSVENLSDCGLNPSLLKHFCFSDPDFLISIECLKYKADSKTYSFS